MCGKAEVLKTKVASLLLNAFCAFLHNSALFFVNFHNHGDNMHDCFHSYIW